MIRLRKVRVLGFVLLLALTLLSGVAYAAESGSQYEVLLERVKNGDPTVDFKELRIAYTKTSQYDPYKKDDSVLEMRKAFNNKDNLKAIEYAEKILASDYVNLRAHTICAMAYKLIGNEEKAKFHKYVSDGIIFSIVYPIGGKDPETALTVISVDEEYVILQVLGLKPGKQELLKLNGHYYDLCQVIYPGTNIQLSVYFCIDAPYNWLQVYNRNGITR